MILSERCITSKTREPTPPQARKIGTLHCKSHRDKWELQNTSENKKKTTAFAYKQLFPAFVKKPKYELRLLSPQSEKLKEGTDQKNKQRTDSLYLLKKAEDVILRRNKSQAF